MLLRDVDFTLRTSEPDTTGMETDSESRLLSEQSGEFVAGLILESVAPRALVCARIAFIDTLLSA